MQYFLNILNRLRASLWLIPAVMCSAKLALAYVLVFTSLGYPETQMGGDHWWLFSGHAASARGLMSAILSGTLTMTSLVVSITMVVLSLASGQLGPRLIDNFLRDRQIQVVLGLFTGTVFYCLFVLRSLTDDLDADRVPHIAITIGTLLAMFCILALLFYVHKIARSIKADTVVCEVADSLEAAILRHSRRDALEARNVPPETFAVVKAIALEESGYVQVIEFDSLLDLATRKDIVIEVNVRPGHFVLRAERVVTVHSNGQVSETTRAEICRAFVIGHERTPTQDLEYSMRQLVEIAVRGLSPGVNDPFTAIAVINRLASALELAANHLRPVKHYTDGAGIVRVLATPAALPKLLDTAWDQIREAAVRTPAVLIQLAHACVQLAPVWSEAPERSALRLHVEKIQRAGQRHIDDPSDLSVFISVVARAQRLLHDQPCVEISAG